MNNVALDVAIGLVFIYLLYSLLATTIKEFIATIFSYRGRMLERGIEQMLDGKNFRYFWWEKLINHVRLMWYKIKNIKKKEKRQLTNFLDKCQINNEKTTVIQKSSEYIRRNVLNKKAELFTANITNHPLYKRAADDSWLFKKPAYLNADTFSDILIDVLGRRKSTLLNTPILMKDVAYYIKNDLDKDHADLKKILELYIEQANGDLQRFKLLIENWYDDMMERVSGWYKRQANFILLIIGLFMAIAFNVSTIDIVKNLSTNKDTRDAIVKSATAYVDQHVNSVKSPNSAKSEPPILGRNNDTAGQTQNKSLSDTSKGKAADSSKPNQTSEQKKEKKPPKAEEKKERPVASAIKDTAKVIDTSFTTIKLKLDSIKSLYENSIQETNTTLGLGWKDFGFTEDSLEWAEKNKLRICTLLPVRKSFFGKIGYVIWQTLITPHYWLGFLITAFAISLGAPFWFDLLNKFINLRVSGAKPDDKSNTTGSKTASLNKPDPTAKG